eukprot:2573165-Rhodomonas_salina.2
MSAPALRKCCVLVIPTANRAMESGPALSKTDTLETIPPTSSRARVGRKAGSDTAVGLGAWGGRSVPGVA